jgi:hypothetical protein
MSESVPLASSSTNSRPNRFIHLRFIARLADVPVHGSRVRIVQVRTRYRNMKPYLAAIGPQQLLTAVLPTSARGRPRPAR